MFKVADNTGALTARCIRILKNVRKREIRIGDRVVVVLKTIKPNKDKLKVGMIRRGIVVRTKNMFKRKRGVIIRFGENAVILTNRSGVPSSKRLKGPILYELCLKYRFIASLARNVI